ncbi:hypothetical protein G7Y89_g7968 [Cudoniella acicularis]|uniref:Heterokaryon incompatibility domain-containing protein n=1 Tax=Cudoniella acicularis TaxID=354080 RepID=A0A8H4RJI9_9HELO|nr:hypothetical protein G7Y89_g7968 [Cudoniella acicularis]
MQDSPEEVDTQIKNMHHVYAGAAFTIVAAAGSDANSGLPGVGEDRYAPQFFTTIQGTRIMTTERSDTLDIGSSKWNSRAWTLQESGFSKLHLVFTTRGVQFRRGDRFWTEDLVLEGDRVTYNSPSPLGMYSWNHLAIEYPRPKLACEPNNNFQKDERWNIMAMRDMIPHQCTFEEDYLKSFAGFLDYFSMTMGEFRFGLPLSKLGSVALLWRTNCSSTLQKRMLSILALGGTATQTHSGLSMLLDKSILVFIPMPSHNLSHLLVFSTSSALLHIDRSHYPDDAVRPLLRLSTRIMRLPDLLEFIVLGFNTNAFAVMLIEWVGDIAYRVQVPDKKTDGSGHFMKAFNIRIGFAIIAERSDKPDPALRPLREHFCAGGGRFGEASCGPIVVDCRLHVLLFNPPWCASEGSQGTYLGTVGAGSRRKEKIVILLYLFLNMMGYEHANFPISQWYFRSQNRIHDRLGPAFVIVNPRGIQVALADGPAVEDLLNRRKDFIKPSLFYKPLEIFGANLDSVNGEDWQRHRKITTPPFNERNSSMVWSESLSQSDGMLQAWISSGAGGTSATNDDTMILALNVLILAAFARTYPFQGGVTSPANGHTMSFKTALQIVLYRFLAAVFTQAIPVSKLFPGSLSTVQTASIELRQYLVEEAKGQGKKTLTDDEIYGNLFIYTFAGYESTASTLAYAITLMAADPQIQSWVKAEILAVINDNGEVGQWDYENLFPRLKRCLALMHETLRLYGPVVSFPRATSDCPQTLTIKEKNYLIPHHTIILSNLTAVHAASDYWGNDRYFWKPQRWVVENENLNILGHEDLLQPPFGTFIPWSAGPRVCPGKKFAQVEFVATIARLFQRHRVVPVTLPGESLPEASARLRESVQDSQVVLTLKIAHPERIALRWEKDT